MHHQTHQSDPSIDGEMESEIRITPRQLRLVLEHRLWSYMYSMLEVFNAGFGIGGEAGRFSPAV